MLNGSNIGIRHVFVRLEKFNKQRYSDVYPAVVVIDADREITEHGLTIERWRLLINQWTAAEYGDVLL